MLSYIYIPVVQRELDIFRTTVWNNQRGRHQRNKELPTGVPEHIYTFPEQHGGESCGIPISDELINEVKEEFSDNFEYRSDYVTREERQSFEQIISTDDVKSSEAADAYKYLKSCI